MNSFSNNWKSSLEEGFGTEKSVLSLQLYDPSNNKVFPLKIKCFKKLQIKDL